MFVNLVADHIRNYGGFTLTVPIRPGQSGVKSGVVVEGVGVNGGSCVVVGGQWGIFD